LATEPHIDVFAYLDYRAYLRDYYEAKKEHRKLSYRALARRIGIKSSSYLKHVIDGDRNLSEEMALRFASGLRLEGDARDYFVELVQFNQAQSIETRLRAHERLRGFARHRELFPLGAQHADYHSTWYMPAIRELAVRSDFDEDPEWIAARLRPKISKREAKHALATLLQLGLLVRDEQGRVRQGQGHLTTGAEAQFLYIAVYHQMMMKLAAESMERFAQKERDISSLTLCLDQEGLCEVKARLRACRRELLELSEVAKSPRQVVQVTMQLFPLSDSDEEQKDKA
jgi:uncharacterized protein (TIGR02147 family)